MQSRLGRLLRSLPDRDPAGVVMQTIAPRASNAAGSTRKHDALVALAVGGIPPGQQREPVRQAPLGACMTKARC